MSGHSFAYFFERFPSLVQTFCYREAEEMIRQGMNPLMISIRRPEDDPPEVSAELKSQVIYLPDDAELTTIVKQWRSEKKIPKAMNKVLEEWRGKSDKHRVYEAAYLAPILKKAGIRHLHVHFAGMAARTAYWLKRFYGIDYSFTGHANDIFCETEHPVQLVDLIRESRFVVTETEFSRNWLRDKFPDFGGKIFHVYNGIQISGFRSPTWSSVPPVMLSVGRYVEKKGYFELIAACRILKEEKIPFRCQIVGEGPLGEQMRQAIDTGRVSDCVELISPKTQPELRASYIPNADLFVLPSIIEKDGGSDNLPTVLMEAMAAGLPVVSTTVAGIPEMVISGKTGFLVPEKNASALADALKKLLLDKELCRSFGKAGQNLVREKFATEVTTNNLKHLLVQHASIDPTPEARKQDPTLPKKVGWLGSLFKF